MFAGYQKLPLPPPWRRVYFDTDSNGGGKAHYMNDITQDVTSVHPFLRFMEEQKEQKERRDRNEQMDLSEQNEQEEKDGNEGKEGEDGKGPGDSAHNSQKSVIKDDNSQENIEDNEDNESQLLNRTDSFQCRPETATTATTDITETNRTDKSRATVYSEFRCLWKELGLFGDRSVFGLSIRYNMQDDRTLVRFDGIDGEWEYSVLEGPYGPVTRYDLFVGAKIKVFGRSLAVTTASRESCQWIEKEYKKMVKQQESMRLRIEKCGNVPIVQRAYIAPVTIFTRDGPGTAGRCDLRRIFNENARLKEQLVKIGLAPI